MVEQIPGLRRYARALAGSPHDADELVQETLAKALACRSQWHNIRNPRGYLFAILHNVFVDSRKAAVPTMSVPLEDWQDKVMAYQPPQLSRLELLDLDAALQQLPSEQRQVVLLVGLEGMPYREVADVLGVPIGTVMSRLSRGRDALRRLMDGRAMPAARSAR